ncbi:hypothetical protein BG015_009723 [Linnemannia schmuckeri]|uniref:Invertebrate defensins family profile domain-containing protein n=1 Tax=Linnemannia schmuckeri TaxID=64567 RepID=A0A9P5V951_9FUNG|nr:hypothetical protein BG015_009723 [Linnemannia schmuckeri]
MVCPHNSSLQTIVFTSNTSKYAFSSKMLKGYIIALFVLVAATITMAAPAKLQKRLTCQIGSIWGGGDAACSASCILKGQGFHGGHCDKNTSICICNY